MTTVPCANVRKNNTWCTQCAYCKTRMFGPEWWLRPQPEAKKRKGRR